MKNIFKLTALAVFLCCLISCDDDEPIIPTLEVTPANLNGTWELSEWNGTPLAEGTYCYITFNRKEQTFEMYQKFDSMYARYITGSFSIKNDPYLGAILPPSRQRRTNGSGRTSPSGSHGLLRTSWQPSPTAAKRS